jgi:hypothetical protein
MLRRVPGPIVIPAQAFYAVGPMRRLLRVSPAFQNCGPPPMATRSPLENLIFPAPTMREDCLASVVSARRAASGARDATALAFPTPCVQSSASVESMAPDPMDDCARPIARHPGGVHIRAAGLPFPLDLVAEDPLTRK